MNENTLLDWLQLSRAQNVGPVTFAHLMRRYGSAAAALEAVPSLAKKGGAKAIQLPSRTQVEAELECARDLGVHLITQEHDHYPALLRDSEGAPPIISVRGNLAALTKPMIGLVGSRNASAAGRKMARILAEGVGAQGYVTVSGLARGIDAAVHEASLSTGTIAILAGGVDQIYPPEHEALYEQIQANGCIISEMPIGFVPRAIDFPRRNRVIAGLSTALVVVEAAERSGSLISARLATEMNREVCAVPGSPLDPRAAGANRLLRDGASVITSAQDIIDAINTPKSRVQMEFGFGEEEEIQSYTAKAAPEMDALHEAVLAALTPTAIEVDVLARELNTPIGHINMALLELELAGKVARVTGNRVGLRVE